jgi:hypothetical protein
LSKDIIISLFDYSGNWSWPYKANKYEVIQVDIKHGIDILTWDYKQIPKHRVLGILAAVPCTDFALSGAKHFKAKDADGRTAKSIELAQKALEIINYFEPDFWVVENPMSRIHKLIPELREVKYKFSPYEFAQYDPTPRNSQYIKQTWLWGKFNNPAKKPMEPVDGQKYWKTLGGKSERTKELRSNTPLGFAWAFFLANQ